LIQEEIKILFSYVDNGIIAVDAFLLSNPIKLALKSDLTPRLVAETYALPFPAPDVLVTLLTIFQQDSFGTLPKDHVVTLGWDKKAPQTI
jgi:hypothetical protein